jgi:hypothetical protein
MTEISPAEIRYIKLGPGGAWSGTCFARGELHFGYRTERHDLAAKGDWDGVVAHYVKEGRTQGKARDLAREFRDFYTLGGDCLWITFADRHLWWAFAEPGVTLLAPEENPGAAGKRRTIDGWRKVNIKGEALRVDTLSSAYRQTICRVSASDYLLRRINAIEEPSVVEAGAARAGMIAAAQTMIKQLHWADFETLVDLILARGGWQRVSVLGGTMPEVDMILEQPTTGERASVQVKSKATQSVLDEHFENFRRSTTSDRTFFVCHSPEGALSAANQPGVHLWTGDVLAGVAVKSGLFDWLMERSA